MSRSSSKTYFRVNNPYDSIESMLAQGIFNTFEAYTNQHREPLNSVQHSIAEALNDIVAMPLPHDRVRKSTRPREKRLRYCYFSSLQESLMIVCQKRVSGNYRVRKVDIEESGMSKSSLQHRVNREFKEDLGSFLTARVHHDHIKDHIFAGVYVVLKAAEDFEGPALDVFKAQLPAFERLRKVYARRDLSGLMSELTKDAITGA